MTKIKNLTGSPFDIQTLSGPRIISAFGTLEAEFDPSYLDLLLTCRNIVLDESDEEDQVVEEVSDTDVEDGGIAAADESEDQEDSLDIEPEPDDVDPVAEAASEDQEAGAVDPEPVSDADKYMALTGKKADGRWSAERLAEELAKLEG